MSPVDVRASGWGWRHAGRSRWTVRDLDVHIPAGQKVLLLGASGSGKSTFLAALAGVLGGGEEGESTGSLLVGGGPAASARGTVGLLLQDPESQIILARVGDDVAFGCENLGVPRDETWRRVRQCLRDVGLDIPLDYPSASLSGGQKQRLALAGVLAMRPGMILLDEPTANLDPTGVLEVRDAVARVVEQTGATLIVVEHRVGVWRDLVDRVVVLDEVGGGILADGVPDAVFAKDGTRLAEAGVWVPGLEPWLAPPRRAAGHVVLAAEGLTIGRGPNSPIASGITASVRQASALVASGDNGSGKTTLALTVGGLIRPLAGTVLAPRLARGLCAEPIRWRSRELASRIGNVFQNSEHQFIAATVEHELAIGLPKTRADGQRARRLLLETAERLALSHLLTANPFTLSGGEQRRLAVATVLVRQPPLLVLDEPTFGQDRRTWVELVRLLIERLDAGTAIVAASHDSEFVAALEAELLVMDGSAMGVR